MQLGEHTGQCLVHTFPLPDLAVHVICCKVHLELPAIEVMLIQVPDSALCCLSVKELEEGKAFLFSCVSIRNNPVESRLH